MQITVDHFIKLKDEDKPKYLCITQAGLKYRVGINASGFAYCQRCGDMPAVAIVGNREEYCQPCFRAINTASQFVKE